MVLVADLKRAEFIDGIEMPENVRQQEMVFGTVVSIGRKVSNETKLADTVCYGPYAGKTVVVEGIELRLLKEGQIEGYIEEANPNDRLIKSTNAESATRDRGVSETY